MCLYLFHLKYLTTRLTLLLLVFSVSRLYFYLLNLNYFGSLGIGEVIMLHVNGIRFDISAIITFNILFILLHIIPGYFKNKPLYQKMLKIIFVCINGLALCLNFIDVEYFKFTNKRTTADIIQYILVNNEDISTLIPQFFKDFWFIALSWLVLITAMWYMYPTLKLGSNRNNGKPKYYLLQSALGIMVLGLCIIGARGLGYKPLRIIDAVKHTDANYMPLVLNTPFTMVKTIGKKDLEIKNYYDKSELDSIYSPVHQYKSNEGFKNLNVVVFILESFSKEYIGSLNNNKGYTPFLDSLIKESLAFSNAFANGKRSIEAVPSILASIPTLMDNAYVASSFAANKINSLASILKIKGYNSYFFHGGNNGTMGFDNFVKAAGFDYYIGRDEYNNEADFDGNWGIFDEEFLQFTANKLNADRQPFLTCVFTLSSHHPYAIPGKYKNIFTEGYLPILKSIEYADFALKKFFGTAKKMPWYNNTLFVFTADHTAQSMSELYKSKTGTYRIPLFFFCPSDQALKGTNNSIAQQSDIMPSVLNYLHYSNEFIAFGNSVFDLSEVNFSINYSDNLYQLVQDNYSLIFDGNKRIAAYDIFSDKLLKNNLVNSKNIDLDKMESKLKAIIQSYNCRMINNKMSVK